MKALVDTASNCGDFVIYKVDIEYKGTSYTRLLANKNSRDGRWNFSSLGPGYVLMTDWREFDKDFAHWAIYTTPGFQFIVEEEDETKAALAVLRKAEKCIRGSEEACKQTNINLVNFIGAVDKRTLGIIADAFKQAKRSSL